MPRRRNGPSRKTRRWALAGEDGREPTGQPSPADIPVGRGLLPCQPIRAPSCRSIAVGRCGIPPSKDRSGYERVQACCHTKPCQALRWRTVSCLLAICRQPRLSIALERERQPPNRSLESRSTLLRYIPPDQKEPRPCPVSWAQEPAETRRLSGRFRRRSGQAKVPAVQRGGETKAREIPPSSSPCRRNLFSTDSMSVPNMSMDGGIAE